MNKNTTKSTYILKLSSLVYGQIKRQKRLNMARFEVTSVKSLTELSNSEYNLMRSLRLKTQSDFGHKNLQIVRFTYSPSYPCFYGEFIMQMTTFCKVSYYAFIIVNLNSKLFWDYQVIFTDFISTDDYSILSFNSISNEK